MPLSIASRGVRFLRDVIDITRPYTPVQSWTYETLFAPVTVALRPLIGERLVRHLPPGARVLDVGAGGGSFSRYVAEQRPDAHVTGIDLSPEQVDRATRASRRLSDRVRFMTGSALELPFPDASFQGVLSVGSIKHWPDMARGFAECLRVLAPGQPFAVIELDRGSRFTDCHRFYSRLRAPAVARELFFPFFRTFVVGQSLDLEDARALVAARAPRDATVERIPETPFLMISGRR